MWGIDDVCLLPSSWRMSIITSGNAGGDRTWKANIYNLLSKDHNKYDLPQNASNEVFRCPDLSTGTSRTVTVNFRQLCLLILSLVPKNQSIPPKRNAMLPIRYIVEVHLLSIIFFALLQIIRKGFLRLHTGVKLFQAKDFFFVLSTDNLSWFTDSDVSETDDPLSPC